MASRWYSQAMTPAEAFLTVLRDAHSMLQTAIEDAGKEVLWQKPPGNTNPIGSIYAHAVGLEDLYIQQIIQGKPMVWEAGGWGEKLGRATSPNLWEGENVTPIDLFEFLSYRRAVYSESELYIASLGGDDLEREMRFPGSEWSMSVAKLLALVVSHCTAHAGEIAALRGVFGGKGLRY
jgi:uncharacterized damage-inducible protein DinB